MDGPGSDTAPSRSRQTVAWALIGVATILLVLAIAAIWAKRQALDDEVWAWFEVAKTPEQIAGRLVIALAAAHWALDQCVPRSQRAWCSIYGGKDDRAIKALERLTRRAVPASLKRLRKEIADPQP